MNQINEELDKAQRELIFNNQKKLAEFSSLIAKDHAERQLVFAKENRDLLKFELSLTPIIIGSILSFGLSSVKGSFLIGLAVLFLVTHFIYGIFYLFILINKMQIKLFKAYRKINQDNEDVSAVENKCYNREVSFEEVLKVYELKKEKINKEKIENLVVDVHSVILASLYGIAILIFAMFILGKTLI